jgi:hypothetical protein
LFTVASGQRALDRVLSVHRSLFTVHCTKHLASQPTENEFQIIDQNVSQAYFGGFRMRRKPGLHKQARQRFGKPLGKRLNILRLDFLRLGVGNPGLQLCSHSPHGQCGENRRAAKQHAQSAGRQNDPLHVGTLYRSLKITRFGETVVWHHNLSQLGDQVIG